MRAMNKKSLFWWTLLGCISGYYCQVNAQSAYHINLDIPDKIIETGHLDLGGVAPDGGSISVNSLLSFLLWERYIMPVFQMNSGKNRY